MAPRVPTALPPSCPCTQQRAADPLPTQEAYLDVTLPVLGATLRTLEAEHRQVSQRAAQAAGRQLRSRSQRLPLPGLLPGVCAGAPCCAAPPARPLVAPHPFVAPPPSPHLLPSPPAPTHPARWRGWAPMRSAGWPSGSSTWGPSGGRAAGRRRTRRVRRPALPGARRPGPGHVTRSLRSAHTCGAARRSTAPQCAPCRASLRTGAPAHRLPPRRQACLWATGARTGARRTSGSWTSGRRPSCGSGPP